MKQETLSVRAVFSIQPKMARSQVVVYAARQGRFPPICQAHEVILVFEGWYEETTVGQSLWYFPWEILCNVSRFPVHRRWKSQIGARSTCFHAATVDDMVIPNSAQDLENTYRDERKQSPQRRIVLCWLVTS
jgi:hypothetical protein